MTKKLCPPLLWLFIFASSSILAQHSVQGEVTDPEKKPVEYANVVLLSMEDSTSVYRGAVTDNQGKFYFENVADSTYLLKVSFIGYKDAVRQIEVEGDVQISPVTLKEAADELTEVSINYRNPSIEKKVDRLIFHVANTALSSGNSWNILKKTPGVIVTQNTLQVRNQPVEVYINNRKVQLSSSELKQLLQNYSGENVATVEVITNPPARYDAEGGAILNIVTNKAISVGYKGSVHGSWTQAVFPKYSFGTSHYQKSEKLNVFVNYSHHLLKEHKEDTSYINFRNDRTIFSRWETDFERITRSRTHAANLMLDYKIDQRNAIILSANAMYAPDKHFRNSGYTSRDSLNGTDSSFRTRSELWQDQKNIGMDLEYRHKLKKAGARFSAKVHLTVFDQEKDQEVNTTYFDNEGILLDQNLFLTDAQQDINIFTGRIDYSTPWGTSIFESGLKASVIESTSGIKYFDMESGGEPTFNPSLSDNFLYDENIYAGYLSLSKEWQSWSFKGGLRGEMTIREGNSQSIEDESRRNYFELFPTFYLMRTISPKHSMTFDYSRRIQRPQYESLNPFQYFLHEHSYSAGNPNLTAAISNNFNLNYTFKNEYFFDLYYRDNGSIPATVSFQDNQELDIQSLSVNMLDSHSYGLDISHGRSIASWWYSYLYTSFFHEEQRFIAETSGNVEVSNEIDGVYGSLYNSFVLSKDGTFTGEMTVTYVSDWLSGSYYLDPMLTVSTGFRKTLLSNRLELTLQFEDILDQTNTWMRSKYLNQDNGFFAQPESQYIRLGVKYKFGNFRLSDNKRAIEAAERERI